MLTVPQLQQRVSELIYRPGWTMDVYQGHFESAILHIHAIEPDTTKPGENIVLDIYSPIPPMLTLEQFDLFISWRLIRIESHESREWLRLKSTGKALIYPHLNDRDLYDFEAAKQYRES